MLRAGDGLQLTFDGGTGEISLIRPDWFIAEITGTVAESDPVIHIWARQQLTPDGIYEDADPYIGGDGEANPAYLPDGGTQPDGLVFMRQRGVNLNGHVEYEILGGGSSSGGSGGGPATVDVVTDVICTPNGLEVVTVTLSGANYDNAVIRHFLALSDVTQKSYTGNQGRAVVVNAAQTGLEFGPVIGEMADTFISLSDTPPDYGTSNTYKALTVSSSNLGISFSDNKVTVNGSLAGGGNPNAPTWQAITLINDDLNPGNSKYYGTDTNGERGWFVLATATEADLAGRVSWLEGQNFATLAWVNDQNGGLQNQIMPLQNESVNASSNITTLQAQVLSLQDAVAALSLRISALGG